jgi:hypothetical protein
VFTTHGATHLELSDALTLHHVYDATGYEDFISADMPDPELSSEDMAWTHRFEWPTV